MVDALILRINGDIASIRNIKRLKGQVPQMLSRTMYKWGKIYEKDTRASAVAANIKSSTGTLLKKKGIEWRQRPRGRIGKLFIRHYGIMLDSMRGHHVAIRRRRMTLLRWALKSDRFDKSARKILAGQMNNQLIYVRKHPFIQRGWRLARPKLMRMIKQDMNRVMATA